MSSASEPVLTGVTYWARDLGPYVWHDFDAERARADLRAVAASGLRALRTLLPWDVFMPSTARPDGAALRNFETLLAIADDVDVAVIPVLFAQTFGDCVFLPVYAIDVDAPRTGVRTVTGGVVQPGGPRDQYVDSRMLEAEVRWLEGMLDAFAGNPVIAMWDLGHDPATTVRPRRIEQLRQWTAAHASRIHEAGERCALTLGGTDITTARGVRLDVVAQSVDVLGMTIDSGALGLADSGLDAGAVAFLLQLGMRLAGDGAPVHAHVAPGDAGTAPDPEDLLRRFGGDVADRIAAIGCSGAHATHWSDCSERVDRLPPFDRHPELAHRGLVDVSGSPTAFGDGWLRATAAIGAAHPPRPWPDTIDSADYYANLPHSIADLYAAWQHLADE